MNIANRHWVQILKNDVTNRYLFNTGRSYTYKSAYSLDKLYPTSNLKLYTPDFVSVHCLSTSIKYNASSFVNHSTIFYIHYLYLLCQQTLMHNFSVTIQVLFKYLFLLILFRFLKIQMQNLMVIYLSKKLKLNTAAAVVLEDSM